MAEIARKLLANDAPLHCIGKYPLSGQARFMIQQSCLPGLESHFIGGSTPRDIPAAMNLFSDQGLEVPMTELDIRIPVNANDQAVNASIAKTQ